MTIVWDDSRMDLPMSVTLTPQEIEALHFAVSVASEHSAEGLTLRASQVAARLLRGSRAFLEVTNKPRAASSSAVAPAAAPAGTDADLELLVLEAIERVAGEIGRIDGLLHVIHARLDALEKQPTADADNTEKIEIDADPRASE